MDSRQATISRGGCARITSSAAAGYVNWVGRSVRQVQEEAALYDAVQRHLQREWPSLAHEPPHRVHGRLSGLIRDDVAAGRLRLSPEPPTPLGWTLRKLLHGIGAPLLLLAVLAGHRSARDRRWC